MDLSDIELDLFEGIPLAKEMGLRVAVAGPERVTVEAPLSRNSNYTHTAFGGSIYSAAVLSCWLLIRLSIEGRGLPTTSLVIQGGTMDYLSPIEDDFSATAEWNADGGDSSRFLDSLARRGVFRTAATSVVSARGGERARFTGKFVARVGKI